MFSWRFYDLSDFALLSSWFPESMRGYLSDLFCSTTFIGCVDGVPAVCCTLLLPESRLFCFLEGYMASPCFSPIVRRECSRFVFRSICDVSRSRGYRFLMSMGADERMSRRFCRHFGFRDAGTRCVVKGL